ncbi:MAG: methyltransferase domain-containing protein [Sedimentisphaerales bacterium]|nr:methyltransferase domain-containing protein [Sedimentisphaerales bacterium]
MIRVREMDIEFYRHYSNALEAAQGPAWRYNEMKPRGFNYSSFILARVYDTYHQMFRDYRWETEAIVTRLGLDASATVLDMGCGTGAFAIHAAPFYDTVHAVDVSKAMLGRARRKARKAGLTNVQFHHGGFLTYEHNAGPVDAVCTSVVLHHLPDFWKLVGLQRLAAMLKPGGRLYLFDVVFSFDIAQYESCFERFIRTMSVQIGPNGQAESQTHLRDEYSTCDWIMEGLLERAGFAIDSTDYRDGFLAAYLCTKKGA